MPRLNNVEPDQATGEVKEIFGNLEQKMGKVINIFKGMGNSAAALKAYLGMAETLSSGELSPQDREALYLSISERKGCNYCVSAHTTIAKGAELDDDQIKEFRKGTSSDDKLKALVEFAAKVDKTNGFVDDADITAVRDAGYSDGQIAEAIAYIGLATYSNLFNHVFDTELDFPQAPSLD